MPELAKANRHGTTPPGVLLAPVTFASAWNVQGARAADVARMRFGVTLPGAPNSTARAGDVTALWLGPASWLLVTGNAPLRDFDAARAALNAAGGALFEVSASRVAYAVAGPRAADVLAAGCPLDFHPRAFPVGACAQSLFARVSALCWRPAADVFVVLVARSFGRDVWHGLRDAALEYGYEERPAAAWPSV